MIFDIDAVRSEFPALALKDNERSRVYFDAPGGTQVPKNVIASYNYAMVNAASNAGGIYPSSLITAGVRLKARESMREFLNAKEAKEIVFGPSMTGLAYTISHALRRHFKPFEGKGEIILTNMEHDANVAPWLYLAEELDLKIKWLEFDKNTYVFNLNDLKQLVGKNTILFAFGGASNLLGTLNDVAAASSLVKELQPKCLVFVDGVQYAPHHSVNVQALSCDFFTCSMYKIYGPHIGVLWIREALLEEIPVNNVRPVQQKKPERFEIGCLPHESLNAVSAAIDYIASIGRRMSDHTLSPQFKNDQRFFIEKGIAAMVSHERRLVARFIEGLNSIGHYKIIGINDLDLLNRKIATVSFISFRHTPEKLISILANENILAWSGSFYAVDTIKFLDLSSVVRFGFAHYNTIDEIDYAVEVLRSIH